MGESAAKQERGFFEPEAEAIETGGVTNYQNESGEQAKNRERPAPREAGASGSHAKAIGCYRRGSVAGEADIERVIAIGQVVEFEGAIAGKLPVIGTGFGSGLETVTDGVGAEGR